MDASNLYGGLSDEQQRVIDLVLEGKSVFVTGAAGTGKSFLLKKLREALKEAGKEWSTFVTAPTGIAAVGVGGCTIHSFAGIGPGRDSAERLAIMAQNNRYARDNWSKCSVLVIDEISMMSAQLFDKLNIVGQRLKGNSLPFGGVQLVLCGDFFQLPPVGLDQGTADFCFNARCWNEAVPEFVILEQVFRQKDSLYLKMLHEIREGGLSDEHRSILEGQIIEGGDAQVDLKSGGGGEAPSPAPFSGGGEEKSRDGGGGVGMSSAADGGGTPASPDARARSFQTHTRLFGTNNSCDWFNRQQLRNIPGPSMVSDATDGGINAHLKNLKKHCAAEERLELKVGAKVLLVKNLNTSAGLVNGAAGVVTEFVEEWGRLFPRVEFEPVEGINGGKGVSAVIHPEMFSIRVGDREVATRVQLPLRVGWALTVHKSQGMTLRNVVVSMRDMFSDGQAYVALSRTTTLEGLHLLDFDRSKIVAHPRVAEFYARLRGTEYDIKSDTGPGVYVLELEGGRFYVGKAERSVARRIEQHAARDGGGAAFTLAYKVLRQVPTVTTRDGSLDAWERAETLEVAHREGIDKVRGFIWVTVSLRPSKRESFTEEVCSRKNLCLKCGWPGHVATSCWAGGLRAGWMGGAGDGGVAAAARGTVGSEKASPAKEASVTEPRSPPREKPRATSFFQDLLDKAKGETAGPSGAASTPQRPLHGVSSTAPPGTPSASSVLGASGSTSTSPNSGGTSITASDAAASSAADSSTAKQIADLTKDSVEALADSLASSLAFAES